VSVAFTFPISKYESALALAWTSGFFMLLLVFW
jgi:hypothetical protein